jgi:hemoglobin
LKSIFERYGGFAKVSRVVSSFYDSVLRSAVLAPYFRSVDMRRLIDHQTKFIAYLMGGPASYTNDHIARVHAHLGITDEAFDEAMALMRETLEDHDYQETDISTVIGVLLSRKPYVVIHEHHPAAEA